MALSPRFAALSVAAALLLFQTAAYAINSAPGRSDVKPSIVPDVEKRAPASAGTAAADETKQAAASKQDSVDFTYPALQPGAFKSPR